MGGGGDRAVEALVALDAAAAGLDVGLHRGEGVVDARRGRSSVRRAAASAAILVSSASRVSMISGSRSAWARIASTIRAEPGDCGDDGAVAVADRDHADHLERDQRLAQRGPADAEPGRELALGRQPVAGLQAVARRSSVEICSATCS